MTFQIDTSAIHSASMRLEVIGNNISNSNTAGFKGSDFSDILATSMSGAIGARKAGTRQSFTQGNITASSNPLDMAISGSGFFRVLSNGLASYTRNGQFSLDKDGNINPDVVEHQFNILAGGLLDRGGHDLFLYIDESSHFSPGGRAFPAYDALMTRARKRNISIVSGCQRPQLLSKVVYTQSIFKWFYFTDAYDVEGWLQRSATPIFERMDEIPYKSYRSLLQNPGGKIDLWEPVPEYDWGAWE